MKEKPKSNTCLWMTLLLGIVVLFVCAVMVAGGMWVNSYVKSIPTVEPCAALLHEMAMNGDAGRGFEAMPYQILVVYKVDGDQINTPRYETVPENLLPLQQDAVAQQAIWDYYVYIIPPEQRALVDEYHIFTDGSSDDGYDAMASVTYELDEKGESEIWALEVDLADYTEIKYFSRSLIHEFGHFLTLNGEQLNFVADNQSACIGYSTDFGCSQPDSYLQIFFDRFWVEIFTEWQAITAQDDPQAVKSGLKAFYEARQDDFISEYAATKPEEDIAESWMAFLLTPRPAGETISQQKVLFFYTYPELVQLKDQIDSNMCTYFNVYHQTAVQPDS